MPEAATAAIVLAAGKSQRMGRLKMLLPFGDKPMLARVIESLAALSEISPIVVVTGHATQEIQRVAGEYPGVRCAFNAEYSEGGMLSSVKAGIQVLPRDCDAFLLVLGDQPMVRSDTLRALRDAWNPHDAPIVVPQFGGARGHPVLFSAGFCEEILGLGPDETLKTLLVRHAAGVRAIAVPDEATVKDIDTPDDYEAALKRWSRAQD